MDWNKFYKHLENIVIYLPYVVDRQDHYFDPEAVKETKYFMNLMSTQYAITDYEEQLSFVNEMVNECMELKTLNKYNLNNTYDYIEKWNNLYPERKWENVLGVEMKCLN